MRAVHNTHGSGEVKSEPIWSKLVGGYVVIFKPDSKNYELPVPKDELVVPSGHCSDCYPQSCTC